MYDIESDSGVSSFENCSDDFTSEYSIEELSYSFVASYVKDDLVYFINTEKKLYKMDNDTDAIFLSEVPVTSDARMLFVSSTDDIYVSSWGGNEELVMKYDQSLKTWKDVLNIDSWRMTEGNTGVLYVGNYEQEKKVPARIYMSEDDGESWKQILTDEDNHHGPD